eukprot:1688694-Prymnesium_polylepis.1
MLHGAAEAYWADVAVGATGALCADAPGPPRPDADVILCKPPAPTCGNSSRFMKRLSESIVSRNSAWSGLNVEITPQKVPISCAQMIDPARITNAAIICSISFFAVGWMSPCAHTRAQRAHTRHAYFSLATP